ncbi:Pleckstrin-likey domain-containing family A member 7 [Varanus komodoensis]|nr:Pleckstrin-likey domain-containing family A member 7 [Varanus komodoensis]
MDLGTGVLTSFTLAAGMECTSLADFQGFESNIKVEMVVFQSAERGIDRSLYGSGVASSSNWRKNISVYITATHKSLSDSEEEGESPRCGQQGPQESHTAHTNTSCENAYNQTHNKNTCTVLPVRRSNIKENTAVGCPKYIYEKPAVGFGNAFSTGRTCHFLKAQLYASLAGSSLGQKGTWIKNNTGSGRLDLVVCKDSMHYLTKLSRAGAGQGYRYFLLSCAFPLLLPSFSLQFFAEEKDGMSCSRGGVGRKSAEDRTKCPLEFFRPHCTSLQCKLKAKTFEGPHISPSPPLPYVGTPNQEHPLAAAALLPLPRGAVTAAAASARQVSSCEKRRRRRRQALNRPKMESGGGCCGGCGRLVPATPSPLPDPSFIVELFKTKNVNRKIST